MEILVDDVFNLFHLYEPSNVKIYEIFKTYHPNYIAALIYLLENIKGNKKLEVYEPKSVEETIQLIEQKTTVEYKICKRPTFTLSQAENVNLKVRNIDSHKKVSGAINLIDFIHLYKTTPYENLPNNCKILLHNLGTTQYKRFCINVASMMLEHSQTNRNEFIRIDEKLEEKFLQYYKYFNYDNILKEIPSSYNFCNIIRPPNQRLYDKMPEELIENYFIQPFYKGFRVVINVNNGVVQCFNRYGKIIQKFLYGLKLDNKHVTFEAVVLSFDGIKPRAWTHWSYRKKFIVIITDIFRLNEKMLLKLAYSERMKYLHKITGTNVEHVSNFPDVNKIYNLNMALDFFNPIVGVVYKAKYKNCAESHIEYKFPMVHYFDYFSNSIKHFDGSVSLMENKMNQNVYINFEMSHYKTVCLVYSNDDKYLYVCKFIEYHFVFVGKIERLLTDTGELNYENCSLYVLNSPVKPKGVIYLRVYYNCDCGVKEIIGYNFKKTTCMHDLPNKYCEYDLFD